MTTARVGLGFDVHAFGPGDHVMLGGVKIPHSRGVIAHSDGDVLLHALCDALLGAAALGDIGLHFPDSDPTLAGIASLKLLAKVQTLITDAGYRVANADLTLISQAPRIAPYREAIAQSVCAALGVAPGQVNVKATTTERLGFSGRGEGLAAQAVVLLYSA